MKIVKNIFSKTVTTHVLLIFPLIILLIFTSCANTKSAQSSKHRKPVSTGKRKCGCSMLSPGTNHSIKLYQQTYYVIQA